MNVFNVKVKYGIYTVKPVFIISIYYYIFSFFNIHMISCTIHVLHRGVDASVVDYHHFHSRLSPAEKSVVNRYRYNCRPVVGSLIIVLFSIQLCVIPSARHIRNNKLCFKRVFKISRFKPGFDNPTDDARKKTNENYIVF